MENKLHTIKIKSTDGSSRAEFRRQFHLIWNKLDIERHRVKKEENKVRENLIASGLSVTNYTEPIPPKIDLNLLVEEGEYTAEEYKQFISQEMAIVTEERKEIIPFSEFESTKPEKKPTTTQKIKVLNTPMLIQIIEENKHLIKIEVRLLDDLKALLATGSLDTYGVITNKKYSALINFINTNYKGYKAHRFLRESSGSGKEENIYITKSGVDVTKENLIKLIKKRYLITPSDVKEVNVFWENIIQKINNKELSVNDVLLNPNYAELLHYIENFEQGIPKQKVNVEKYREALIHKVAQVYNEKKRVRDKTLLEKLKNHSISLLDIMKENQEVFLILSALEIDIQQFNEYKLYPKLNLIYKEFALSKWYAKLGVNNIYFKGATSEIIINKDGTYSYLLDDITINALVINLEKKTTYWGSIRHYEAETKHVFEYLIKKAGKISSFRGAVPYVKDHKIKAKGFASLVIDNFKFSIHGFSSPEDFDIKLDLRPEYIKASVKLHHGTYSYYLHFKDEKGDQKRCYLQTKDYLAFEMLVKKLGVNLKASFTEPLANVYIEGIRKSKNQPNKLSRYFASLPTSAYRTSANLRIDTFTKVELEGYLEKMLSKTFTWDAGLSGANEEVALLSVLRAMKPEDMYTFLHKRTDLLYEIVDRVDGAEYERLLKYLGQYIPVFDAKSKVPRALYLSESSYIERKIHIESSDWKGENTISFDNHNQSSFIFKYGKKVALNEGSFTFHPLELVAIKTVINGKEVGTLKVPAFYLYKKLESQSNWDTFEFLLDLVSVASIYGSVRFLATSAIKHAGKKVVKKELLKRALAVANIAKETSSFAIRSEEITEWMLENKYENLLTTWKILDTTGDLIYLGSSLKSLKKINLKKVKEGVQQGFDKNIVESYTKFKQYIYEVDEVIQKLVQEGKEVPAKLRQHMFDLEKDLNIFLDNVIVANGPEYQLAFAMLDNSAKTGKKLNFEAAFDAVGNARNTRKAERVAKELAKKAAIKKKYDIEHLTAQQSKYFEAIEELNITNKELLEKVIQHGKNTSGVTITPKKVVDNIKKGLKYDKVTNKWKNPNKIRKDRIKETIRILKERGYTHLVKLAEQTKKYAKIHDEGLKKFILKATDEKFNEYLNIFRVDGKAGNAFMPYYKQLGEGLEALRKTGEKIEKVSSKELKKVMKGYERHHQVMVSVMKDNPTFQKIMDWALKRNPPLDIGFNDFKRNIIILHKEQHGYHNITTGVMRKKISNIDLIFDKTEKSINKLEKMILNPKDEKAHLKAFNQLKNILKREEKSIIKEVIQNKTGGLDKRYK
ncbi:hypothetical protein [Tenacibaculum halocynthiae]|uniref:hypothetical protein n=1 Tax=Tenacibaculum halocynthiae TaxID=1254437 RepID=UPI003D65DB38